MQERRHNTRVIYTRPVELKLGSGQRIETWSKDFSMQGIAIIVEQSLQVGESVDVKMDLQTGRQSRPINLAGKIVYTRDHGDGFVSGIEFI